MWKLIKKLKVFIIGVILLSICILIKPQIFHKNKGESESIGDYNGGSMKNGYLLPRSDKNFICYSWFSYYLLGREYINSKVCNTVLASYTDLEKSYPNRKFVYMEAAKRKGGRMYPHRTHQSGLSMDFMSPLVKRNGTPKYFKLLGIFRYALNFNIDGKSTLNSDISIDFNLIAEQ